MPETRSPQTHTPAPTGGSSIELVDDDGPLLVLAGTIDRDAVRRFRVQVPPALWPERIDLCGVHSLGQAGIELLLHLARKPRRQGRELDLVGAPLPLRPELERAGLANLIRPSTADC